MRRKKFPSLQFMNRDRMRLLLTHPRNGRSMPLRNETKLSPMSGNLVAVRKTITLWKTWTYLQFLYEMIWDRSSIPNGPKFARPCFNIAVLVNGTVSRDFRLLVFFHESLSPKHLSIPVRPFQIFSKIRGDIRGSRWTTGVVDVGGKWKKSSSRKILIILFGHLWVVEWTYK